MGGGDLLEAHQRDVVSEDRIGFALAATDSYVWSVDLDDSELRDRYGPGKALFNLDYDVERVSEFIRRSVHPKDVHVVERAYRRVADAETDAVTVDFRTHPENGEVRWIETEAHVKIEDGDRFLVGVSTDVTDRKREHLHVERQNERLEEFVAVLSHDLRNPLNVLSGALELATDECEHPQLDRARDAIAEMESLIEDLLTSVEAGEPIVRGGQAIDAAETVQLASVAERSWQNVESTDATLAVETDQTIVADRNALQQLFENLFRNAVEHVGPDVSIVVGALEDAAGFYVADDGPGIPEADREKIFDTGHSTSETGIGLGLHIVQEIVETQGWDVTVTDSPTGGARFEISDVTVE